MIWILIIDLHWGMQLELDFAYPDVTDINTQSMDSQHCKLPRGLIYAEDSNKVFFRSANYRWARDGKKMNIAAKQT